ncbi:MAG: CPBP family intramembrane metalloprotease [Acidobacteriota bacterium]|nr:CPBP family intramembrane metalloprotease [Acidobacteriota bacterium]
MPNSLARFRAVVGVGWVALGIAAALYARMKGIPAWAAVPVAAAFLIEFPFYLLPAFAPERLARPWIVAAMCVAPYLIYSIGTGEFRPGAFGLLAAIALALAYWFPILPKSGVTDVLFLFLVAAIYLSKIFDRIYLPPVPKLPAAYLGHVMLIRVSVTAIIAIRGDSGVEFRFIPNRREWVAGLRWFAVLMPLCGLALRSLNIAHLRPHPHALPVALAELVGIFWMVAMPEEFLFRGLLQQWFERWTSSAAAGLIVASLLFGSAHLWFHSAFPNWRFSIVAAVFGACCGMAWRETRSIQSSMVTHGLAAALYRIFFQ